MANSTGFNFTLETLRNFIVKMNLTQEDIFAFLHEHFANATAKTPTAPIEEECLEDPEKYCAGPLRTFALSYKKIHGYLSLIVCIFGIIANSLNIAVLSRREMSVTPINRILTGLAIADALVMLEYVPFSSYMYLVFPDTRSFPFSWAGFILFHVHLSQVLHTISISLTLALAIWRYIAIRLPQRNSQWCNDSRCRWAILTSYILPIILCIPSYFVFHIRATTIKENSTDVVLYHLDVSDIARWHDRFLCKLTFWIYGVIIKLVPCVSLTVIICRLIQALYKIRKRKRALQTVQFPLTREAAYERRMSRLDRKTDRTTKMLVAVLLLFLITELPQGIFGLLSGILGTCFFRNCYNLFGELMDILALINGAINFILYCCMSRQFRHTFSALFRLSKLMRWVRRTSDTELRSSYI